jgi:hypothetical protein
MARRGSRCAALARSSNHAYANVGAVSDGIRMASIWMCELRWAGRYRRRGSRRKRRAICRGHPNARRSLLCCLEMLAETPLATSASDDTTRRCWAVRSLIASTPQVSQLPSPPRFATLEHCDSFMPKLHAASGDSALEADDRPRPHSRRHRG